MLQTEKVKLKCDDLPLEANNLRIVYLSDIHYGFWFGDGDLSRLVGRINNLRPDLVLFGGGYATDNQTAIEFFRALQKQDTIHSRYGIYGVIGETDRGDSDFTCSQLTEAMANSGVVPLVNKAVTVNIAARRIYIAGVDDMLTGRPDLKSVARSVSAADYVIFMNHNPSIIPEEVPERYRGGWLKENRVDLLISRGVGTSVYPGRLFCFPQIHYLTVTYK